MAIDAVRIGAVQPAELRELGLDHVFERADQLRVEDRRGEAVTAQEP